MKISVGGGNNLVSIPFRVQVVKRGQPAMFGVGVRNRAASREFSMQVSYSGASAPDGESISVDRQYVDSKWLGSFKEIGPFLLQKNQQKVVPVLIRADVNTAPGVVTQMGDYVFNVCVYPSATPTVPCTGEQYARGSDSFYSGKIYQVVVRVS